MDYKQNGFPDYLIELNDSVQQFSLLSGTIPFLHPNNQQAFDQDYINKLNTTIFASTNPDEINDLLISLRKYTQKYPNETITFQIQNNFFNHLFKFIENKTSYSNSILLLIYTFFINASQGMIEGIVSDDYISLFMNILRNDTEPDIISSILLIFSSLIYKSSNISKKIVNTTIWNFLMQLEAQTSYLNEIFQSETYQNHNFNEAFIQKTQDKIRMIEEEERKKTEAEEEREKTEAEDGDKNEEDEVGEKEEEEEESPDEIEKMTDKQKEKLSTIYNGNFFLYYHCETNLNQERKEKKKQLEIQNKEKKELYEIHYIIKQIPFFEVRASLFIIISSILKQNISLISEMIEFKDFLNLLQRNFFKEQNKVILNYILQSYLFLCQNNLPHFLDSVKSTNFYQSFLEIISSVDDEIINRNCLHILSQLTYFDFIEFKYICSCVQRILISKNIQNIISSLQIIQKYSSNPNYFQVLKQSRTFSQICSLLKNPHYTVSNEAFKTFFQAIQSVNNSDFIDLTRKFPIMDTAIDFLICDDDDCVEISLNIILRLIQIIKNSKDLDYLSNSLVTKCDFSLIQSLVDDEESDDTISKLALMIMNEIPSAN